MGYGQGATGQEAFIWDATHGMRALRQVLEDAGLDLTDWILIEATGVSAGGLTIVGNGTNPSGGIEPGSPPASSPVGACS